MDSSSPSGLAPDLPADCGPSVRRTLVDRTGVRWEVWCCIPATAKGGLTTAYAAGWLTFESAAGEKRRHAPAPRDWRTMSDEALRDLLGAAKPAGRVRTVD